MVDEDLEIIELNKSTNFNAKDVLRKRASAKWLTNQLMYEMVKLKSPLHQGYVNTLNCSSELKAENGKITAIKYCKNRWCLICSRIRTAVAINRYYETIESWGDDKYFVTLTLPNCRADELSDVVVEMLDNLKKIRDVFYKRKINFVGLRKLEVTFNKTENTFHPHFHFIIKGLEVSEILLSEWLKRYPKAESFCQDIRACDNRSAKEMFKYFQKLISSKSIKKEDGEINPVNYWKTVNVEALDIIFQAVKNRRIYQSFGFKAKIVSDIEIESIDIGEINPEIQYYSWVKGAANWINTRTGEFLTDFDPFLTQEEVLNELCGDCERV